MIVATRRTLKLLISLHEKYELGEARIIAAVAKTTRLTKFYPVLSPMRPAIMALRKAFPKVFESLLVFRRSNAGPSTIVLTCTLAHLSSPATVGKVALFTFDRNGIASC